MFSTAPVIRKNRNLLGQIAMTDFVKIYICDDVSEREYEVLLKHEQAHIWCEHKTRFIKGYDFRLWNIACDMEIARNIYMKEDEAIIKAPFSRIEGGLVSDSYPDMPPDLLLAEEIYDWISKNKKQTEEKNFVSDIIEALKGFFKKEGNEGDIKDKEQIKEIIEEAKEELKKALSSRVAEKNTKLSLKEIIKRKPSLTSEIDAALRYRTERSPSYRRPPRREIGDKEILKGKLTKKQPPLVEIFIDRSGSFTPEKTEASQEKLGLILKKYNTSIKHDVWFFGSGKISSTDFIGGDTPYHLIYEHLLKTKPKLAIIITDSDPVSDSVEKIVGQKILCVPIGCESTSLSKKIGGIDVMW